MAEHSHDHSNRSIENLRWVLILTGGFMVVELAAGLLTGSLALLADAGHMIRDSIGLVIAFIAAKLSQRPSDANATYGYKRYEVLAAFVNSLLLFGLLIFILIEAVQRFINPEAIHGEAVLLVGVLGLIVNIIGIFLLRGDASENINIRGAYIEVMADALGSVGVIASGLIIMFTDWVYADGIVALAIAAWIVPRTWSLFRDAGRILLEAKPEVINMDELDSQLTALENVECVHDLHVWSLTENSHLLSVHLETKEISAEIQLDLIRQAQAVAKEHGIEHATVQIEPGAFDDEQLNCD